MELVGEYLRHPEAEALRSLREPPSKPRVHEIKQTSCPGIEGSATLSGTTVTAHLSGPVHLSGRDFENRILVHLSGRST